MKTFVGTHRANFNSGGRFRCLPTTFLCEMLREVSPRERLSSQTGKKDSFQQFDESLGNHLTANLFRRGVVLWGVQLNFFCFQFSSMNDFYNVC